MTEMDSRPFLLLPSPHAQIHTRAHTHPKLYLSPLEITQGQGGGAGGDQSHGKTSIKKQAGGQGCAEMLGRRGRGTEVMVGRKVEKDEQKPLYNRAEREQKD